MELNNVFGIDLGTTQTAIARYTNSGAEIIQIDQSTTCPSVISRKDNQWIVGQSAINHGLLHPNDSLASVKRKMETPQELITVGDQKVSPIDASAIILSHVAEQASATTGIKVKNVVITVPAWFGEIQRQATLAAGEKAGLNVLKIINEPTAAGLACGQDIQGEQTWAIYDLGGGTFDVSIMRVTQSSYEILASQGDCFLGGDDFDQSLYQLLNQRFKETCDCDANSDPVAKAKLLHIAQKLKINLSKDTEIHLQEPLQINNKTLLLDTSVSRADFIESIQHYLDKTFDLLEQALVDANVTMANVDNVLLVGGSTRIPAIADQIDERYKMQASTWLDPDLAIALGAANQAGIETGQQTQFSVVDICPHSLGISCIGDDSFQPEHIFANPDEIQPRLIMVPLIRKNSRLPAQHKKRFFKMDASQKKVELQVYQGEKRFAQHNTFIGQFYVEFSNPKSVTLDVDFVYTSNGTIEVSVYEERGASRTYSMNLGQSAQVNSESQSLFSESTEDSFDEIISNDQQEDEIILSSQVFNALINKIQTQLKVNPDQAIESTLAKYIAALETENDNDIDVHEDILMDWLESLEDEAELA